MSLIIEADMYKDEVREIMRNAQGANYGESVQRNLSELQNQIDSIYYEYDPNALRRFVEEAEEAAKAFWDSPR